MFLIVFVVLLHSCETSTLSELAVDDSEPVAVVTYQNTVQTIIDNSCVECHNINNATAGIRLDSFESSRDVADSGRMLIRMTSTTNPMPPSGNLPDAIITNIERWIEDGLLEN